MTNKVCVDVYGNTLIKVKTFIMNYILFFITFSFAIICYFISIELEKDIIDARIIGYLMIISGISVFFPFYSNATIFFGKDNLKINNIVINYSEINNICSENYDDDFINTFSSQKIILSYNYQESIEVIINRHLWKSSNQRVMELKEILDNKNIKNSL